MNDGRSRGPRQRTTIDGRQLALSNLDKVLYPAAAFTKGDVIDYYRAVAPALLPHLRGRPLTVKRFPDGVEGKAFFEKRSPAHRPDWVRTITVRSERSGAIDYTLVEDTATLLWLAHLAALELHTPLAREPDLTRPTALVFDLDPGAPATIIDCCRVALWLCGAFDQLSVASFAKTSGAKGIQVYVPLSGEVSYDDTKRFARDIARLLERAQPGLVVSRMTRALRAGKVLIDWSQNDEHKTTVCAYSLRATELPTVSTPLRWDEVRAALAAGDARSLRFAAPELPARLERHGDLFAEVLTRVQTLPSI